MARAKQDADCLFCGNTPCTCYGAKKEKKPRAKKAAAPKVRPEEAPVVQPEGELVQGDSPVPSDAGAVLRGEVDAVFPSQTGRRRARFARKGSTTPDQADNGANHPNGSAPAQAQHRLPQDEESVAIRNLARAGLLHERELRTHADKINPPKPIDLQRRLAEWRSGHGT